jgi:hypothetical protein
MGEEGSRTGLENPHEHALPAVPGRPENRVLYMNRDAGIRSRPDPPGAVLKTAAARHI